MRSQTKNALLSRGFPTDLIEKIERHGHTVAVLDAMSKEQLGRHYDPPEVELIAERIKRQPIPEDVLDRVIDAADGVCCYCGDGDSSRPYQIHHIEEYSVSQDNSEDNLLLVCPTHHVSVPKQFSQAVQKATRRRWHAVVAIAKAYRARGVQFPFGRFVAYDYGFPPFPPALVKDYRVPASTALALATSDLALDAERRLRERGFLLLLGASGSGKTTLAVGVAGRLAAAGFLAFRYDPPKSGGRNPMGDVLTFLATADRPCVLILDDANLDFREEQLAEIRAAAGRPVVVIATWTRGDGKDDARTERQFPDAVQVTWPALRPTVREFLLANQASVVPALQAYRDQSRVFGVGLGRMDVSLEAVIAEYEARVKTVSEFLFLLRGGTDAVRQDLARLIEKDRADMPVLYAAVEQLAGFERTVTPDEVAKACPPRTEGGPLPEATPAWVESVFDEECGRRRMQRLRGEYTTLHRDWARRLVGVALGTDPSRADVERFLARDFDCRTKEPLRLMRLWTWLWYDEFGGPFVRHWIDRQPKDEWAHLVGTAANQGLVALGVVADRLHSAFLRAPEVIAAAFASYEEVVSLAVQTAGPTDWFNLQHVFRAISQACPEYAARVVERWDPRACAAVLGDTDPPYYDPAWWFFSGVKNHSPGWVTAVGEALSWEAVSQKLAATPPGQVDDVLRCQSLLVRLGVRQRRSMVRRYGEVIRSVLRDARLTDIRACPLDGMALNLFFPFEVAGALEAIDPARAAAELEAGPPRVWATFADLTALPLDGDTGWPAAVIGTLNPQRLAWSVESQAFGNEFELRVFLFGLARGEERHRSALAGRLYPAVLGAARRSEVERSALVTALYELDRDCGKRLAAEVGAPLDVNAVEERLARKSQRGEALRPVREQIARLDQTGEDYDVSELTGPIER
jgi:hypothetical protein